MITMLCSLILNHKNDWHKDTPPVLVYTDIVVVIIAVISAVCVDVSIAIKAMQWCGLIY